MNKETSQLDYSTKQIPKLPYLVIKNTKLRRIEIWDSIRWSAHTLSLHRSIYEGLKWWMRKLPK